MPESQQDADNQRICSEKTSAGFDNVPGRCVPSKAAELRVMGNNIYAANRNDKLFGDHTEFLATYTLDSFGNSYLC